MNLMKAHLGYRNVRSLCWVVKKAPARTYMMYDKYRVVLAISKSSFLFEEQKRKISRGYCRDNRPSSIYWAGGPI